MENDINVTISQHAFKKQQHIHLKNKTLVRNCNRDHIEQDEDDHRKNTQSLLLYP